MPTISFRTVFQHRSVLAVMLFGVIAILSSSCTYVHKVPMEEAFPVSKSMNPAGPAVVILPVQESPEPGPYKDNDTFLGGGTAAYAALGPIFFPPVAAQINEYYADIPRTDIARKAAVFQLRSKGIPAIIQDRGGNDQLRSLPENYLALSLKIRKLNVDTEYTDFLEILIVSAIRYFANVVLAELDCQVWQGGSSVPVWEGTGISKLSTKDFKERVYVPDLGKAIVGKAVTAAVNQCIVSSGLVERRSKLNSQRYTKLMADGRKLEEGGSAAKALELYGQAYETAVAPEQQLEAIKAAGRTAKVVPGSAALPEDARKFRVQAELAIQDKKYNDAFDLYGQAINSAPWWPDGHYNRALVSAEAGDLPNAMMEMKRYLALVPSAPDAGAAQEMIYGWERGTTVPDALQKNLKGPKRQTSDRPAAAGASGEKPQTVAKSAGAAIFSDVDAVSLTAKRSRTQAYAVVIGIEQYRQALPKADFAVRDAQVMTEYLIKVLGYPEQNVISLTNDRASNVDLAKYLEKWLPNNIEAGGEVFVYFSGHGAPNPKTGDAYLVPYDGDPSFIEETGYSLKRLYAVLGKLPTKEITVALDSCFSGAGGRSVIAKGARPIVLSAENPVLASRNITVLSASAADQISSTYDEKGHGLFTYFMLKGIKDEKVVRQDGSLDVAALYSYMKPQVMNIARKKYNNEQTPQLIGAKKH